MEKRIGHNQRIAIKRKKNENQKNFWTTVGAHKNKDRLLEER